MKKAFVSIQGAVKKLFPVLGCFGVDPWHIEELGVKTWSSARFAQVFQLLKGPTGPGRQGSWVGQLWVGDGSSLGESLATNQLWVGTIPGRGPWPMTITRSFKGDLHGLMELDQWISLRPFDGSSFFQIGYYMVQPFVWQTRMFFFSLWMQFKILSHAGITTATTTCFVWTLAERAPLARAVRRWTCGTSRGKQSKAHGCPWHCNFMVSTGDLFNENHAPTIKPAWNFQP